MANINRVVLVGNLTRDPELRHTPSGTAVCKLRIAVNTRMKDGATGQWMLNVTAPSGGFASYTGAWAPGSDPEHHDYASFADFADPDGNTWVLQEVRRGGAGA